MTSEEIARHLVLDRQRVRQEFCEELQLRLGVFAEVRGARLLQREIRLSGERDTQEDVRWAFDITRARRAFGYAPSISLSEGLRRLAETT